jgi:hypothetical protein
VRTIISGATGFLGRALVRALRADGHEVAILSRSGARGDAGFEVVRWQPDGGTGPWAAQLEGADYVINLAGEPIAARRWSRAQKQRIFDSRILATRSLAAAIAQASHPPAVLVSGSGVGYYGPRGEEVVAEETGPGSDFLAEVCKAWEAEAIGAERSGVRVALIRTGLVLEADGGALREIVRPFRMFVGGPLGTGRQYMPWIHRDDWIGIVRMLLRSPDALGAFNGTGPAPVTNAEFSRALGGAIGRPSFMRAPAPALRMLLGEMADSLLLTGQRAVPARALASGYQFKYRTLEEAFASIFKRGSR